MLKRFGDVPVFWINLSDSAKRRLHMEQELRDYPNNVRVEAVDGRVPNAFRQRYRVTYTEASAQPGVFLTTAVIAVICSHLKAIKTGFDAGHELICVVEDDAHFELVPHYPHTVAELVAKAPVDWEVIQLYYTQQLEANTNDYLVRGLQLLPRDTNYSGTCYLMNRRGMERVLSEVARTNGSTAFEILHPITDPENTILGALNAYVVNLPFCYYYADTATFTGYTTHIGAREDKKYCERVQFDAKEKLIAFFKQWLVR